MCPMGEESYVIINKIGTIDSNATTGKFYIDLLPSETLNLDEGYYTFQASVTQGVAIQQTIENTIFIKGAIL